MNLKLVDTCIKAYDFTLPGEDKDRLAFFRGLWEVMAQVEGEAAEYDAQTVARAIKEEVPLFALAAPSLDEGAFQETAKNIAGYLANNGGFDDDLAAAVSSFDWKAHTEALPLKGASKDFEAYFDSTARHFAEAGATEQAAHMAALVCSLSLRALVERQAACASRALKAEGSDDAHPLRCPVCGTAPSAAHVGGQTSSAGRGKTLYCHQCGTVWEFERVRCVRCGSRDQEKLHFFNVEGDEAHRIATCDECGNYIRTVYSENDLAPFSFEVEDVVMARLDAIAQDPRIMKKSE